MAKAQPKWDRHSILAEFRRRGVKLTEFAIENGRNPNTFRTVWTRWNRPNEKLIADFLGDPVEAVWPDRYPITANRIFDSRERPSKASQKTPGSSDMVAA